MNYIIEDGISFSSLLNISDNEDSDNNTNQLCLLSGQLLELNHITLPCQHKFNYKPLYNEIIARKFKHNRYSVWRESGNIATNQIECPYCRKISNKLLPYCPEISNIKKINGVNFPKKYTMNLHTCNCVLKCGPNKGSICNKQGFLYFDETTKKTTCLCLKHWKSQQKSQNKIKNSANAKEKYVKVPTFTKLEASLNKKYKVVDLKNILRENKQKLTGNKYDLIKRVILKNLF